MRLSSASISLLPLVFLSGCGLGITTGNLQPGSSAHLTQVGGSVHGGNQPVIGATVQLWQAGTGGYGLGASALGSSVTTGAGGSFTLTGAYTCPSPNTLVYITATGGNPGLGAGTNNTALVMMTALGVCGNLTPSTFISINEVTTVASVYALEQFMSPLGNVGSYTSATNGLFNAFATVNNLVNTTTGTALSITPSGNGVVPQAEINTLANILTPCVNSTGPTSAACSALFAAATPSGGQTPVSTLSAAIGIAQNPSQNQTALFNLATANASFQPTLSAAPNDWTVALSFATGGAQPYYLALDSLGNLWIGNYGATGGSTSSLSMISTLGVPAANSPFSNTNYVNGARGIAVDSNNNVWLANYGTNSAMKFNATYNGTNYSINTVGAPLTSVGLVGPHEVAIDGSNNVWFTNYTNSTVTEMYSAGGSFTYPSTNLSHPQAIAIDANNNAWVTNTSSTTITELNNGNSASFAGGGINTPSGIAVDSAGDLWMTETFHSSVAELNNSGTPISGSTGYTGGGLTLAFGEAIDGSGNVWVADYLGNRMTELNSSGATVTSAAGYQGGSLSQPTSVAIDAGGDIWITDYNPATVNGQAQTVTEFVGLAAPAVMPLATAIQGNQIGLKPGSLSITSRGIGSATQNTFYSYAFGATGGDGSYTWSITSGLSALQAIGLSFSSSGVLSGTPTAINSYNFTVQVTDTITGQIHSAPFTLQVNSPIQTVCSHDGTGNSFLHGDYAFLMNGFNPSGHYYDLIGAFTANGAGTISGGLGDANGDQNTTNFSSGSVHYTFSGTYSMGSTDDRGIMNVTNTNSGTSGTGLPTTATYCFAADTITAVAGLGTVAESGRIIETDPSGFVLTGFFTIQNPSNFNSASISSGYAFGMQGVDGTTPNRRGLIGQFTADGSGNISSGQMDFSAVNFSGGTYVNSYSAANAITGSGSSYSVASNGRGTLTLNLTGTPLSFIFYLVGTGNQLYLMSSNASASGTTPLLVGHAIQQAATSFTTASLKGSGVFRSSGTTSPNSPPLADNVEVGQFTLDGSGNLTYIYDENSGGTISTPTTNSGAGTYAVTSIGYMTTTGVPSTPASYLWAPNAGFGLDSNISVDVLFMLPQTIPSGGFTTANLSTYLNGNYAAGTMFPSAYSISNSNNQYPAVFDLYANFASGSVSVVQDEAIAPGTLGFIQVNATNTDTYALDPTYGASSGRFTLSNGSKTSVVGYIISPTQVFLIQNQPGQDSLVIQGDHW